MTRLLTALCLLLAACTNSSDDFELVRDTLFPGRSGFDPRFEALARQRPEILRIGLLDREVGSNVVLESRRGEFETWLTPDGASIITRQGILVGMRGFGEGLLSADVSEPLTALLQNREGLTERFHTYLTGNDETVTRTYRCLIERRDLREITLGSATVQTRRMTEACRSLDQAFTNLYWISQSDNQIVQSRQWSGDYIGVVLTRVVPQ